MGRELRADPEGGVHHVSNRGARQYTTFIDDVDRRSFLDLVGTAAVKHEISVLAYCLMGNHYHLLVSCRSGGLSLFVHGFASAYSRRFNRDHGFSGPLNGDRFWSGVVDGDDHLITVARYIHRNPVELGFDARSYRWSSYRHYLQASGPDWLNRVPLLTASGGRQALQRIVECDVVDRRRHR